MKNFFKNIFCSIGGLRIVCIISTVVAVILAVLLIIPDRQEVTLPTDTDTQSQTESFEDGEYSEGKIYYNEGSLGQMWISVLPNVPKSDIAKYSFRETDEGYKYYINSEGEKTSMIGIDVSYYQGEIDWEKVRAAGIEYAILRCGLRGYETGQLRVDEKFHEYIKGANEAGVPVGVYFFSQAVSTEEAIEEAHFVLEQIKGYQIDFPIVYDWETIGESSARTNSVSAKTLTDCTIAFCEEIKAAGYTPMYYTNRNIGYRKLDLSRLCDYDLWIADFNEYPSFYYKYTMWQYSYTGRVDGIENDVDLNVCFKNYAEQEPDRLT